MPHTGTTQPDSAQIRVPRSASPTEGGPNRCAQPGRSECQGWALRGSGSNRDGPRPLCLKLALQEQACLLPSSAGCLSIQGSWAQGAARPRAISSCRGPFLLGKDLQGAGCALQGWAAPEGVRGSWKPAVLAAGVEYRVIWQQHIEMGTRRKQRPYTQNPMCLCAP